MAKRSVQKAAILFKGKCIDLLKFLNKLNTFYTYSLITVIVSSIQSQVIRKNITNVHI